MSKALDRSQRSGSDPIQIGSTKLVTDGNNDLTIQDTSNNRKKILASELHIGDSNNVVILKKGSDNNIQFQTQASGGSATSSNAGGTVVYATINDMTAVSASAGDQALVTANSGLYVHNGGGWYKIATINTSPTISSPSTGASNALSSTGVATTIELVTSDPDEGTTLQNSYAVTSGTITNLATVTTSATSGGTYSALNPSTNTTNRFFKITPNTSNVAGSFTLTFSVSDSVNVATTVQSFTLAFGGSAVFDGNGDYLVIPNSNNLEIGTNNFTIEFWTYLNSYTNYPILTDRRANSGSGTKPVLFVNLDGTVRWFASGGLSLQTSTSLTTGNWHHIAVVRNSNTTKIYLDGVARATLNSDTHNYSGSPITLGYKHNATGTAYLDGYISNYREVIGTAVYTNNFTVPTSPLSVVTNTQLLTCQNSTGSITDFSSNNFTITENGNVSSDSSSPF